MVDRKIPTKGDREFLERLLIASGGNYTKFARQCGLKPSALRHYIERGGEPTRPVLLKIANSSGLNLRWLAEGVGPMRIDAEEKIRPQLAQPDSANPSYQDLLKTEHSRWFNELLELEPTTETRIRKYPVRSKSMSPTLEPGEFILVNEADHKLRKGIFLLREDSEPTIRRLRLLNDSSVMIQEDNPEADSEHLSLEEFERRYKIVGRVLGKVAPHLDP
jgi:phage repressor protein C with HTH and peptisase S24 domain